MRAQGLYDPAYEHDACGVALVARLDGRRTHDAVTRALDALERQMTREPANAQPWHARPRYARGVTGSVTRQPKSVTDSPKSVTWPA